MADNFNMEAQISADVSGFIADINRLIDRTRAMSKELGAAGVNVNKLDRQLNASRTTLKDSSDALKSKENAEKAAATATALHAREMRVQESQLIRARYALYDVATSYAAVSAATLGAVAATSLVSARYETAFTEIERTTLTSAGAVSANIDALREQFLDLSEVIPLSFQELTKIGSLGAQLGIAENDLVSFTETVAQFSKLSGISAEESALAFGRIGELLDVPASQYVNLGSSIAYVASQSAATEAQLISVAKETAAAASGAGFAAAEVIGLAGSLASLGVAPEKSRGSLETFFGTLNTAVGEGGQALEDFAQVVGVSASELDRMVRAGEGQEVLRGFIEGLNDLDNVATTQALDRLGLAQLRVTDTFKRLSQNLTRVETDMNNALGAFESGTFLGDAFAVVLDDVASQFQLLLNSIGRFLATAGLPFLEFLRVALPNLAEFFTVMSDFAETDFGQSLFKFFGFLAVGIGVLAAMRGAAALTAASVFAVSTAAQILGGTGVISSIRAATGSLLGMNAAALTLKGTLAAVAKSLGGLAAAAIIFDQLFSGGAGTSQILGPELGGAVNDLFAVLNNGALILAAFTGNAEDLKDIIASWVRVFGGAADAVGTNLNFISELLDVVVKNGEDLRTLNPIFGGVADAIAGIIDPINQGINRLRVLVSEAQRAGIIAKAAGRGFGGRANAGSKNPLAGATAGADEYAASLDNVGASAGGAGAQVRTLVDYANDLRGVFGRAFDIRFGSQLAVDEVADSWETLGERIRDARIEIQQLTADRSIKEYFLTVANAYGDELRAGVLRGEIAELNEKIADTQADASTELQGNSKAARQNRSVITGLLKNYEDYITALAEGGADQSELNAAVARSRQEFLAQAQALGFSNSQLEPYVETFNDLRTVIAGVPRNITVTANLNPALQALNEFVASAKAAVGGGIKVPVSVEYPATYTLKKIVDNEVYRMLLRAFERGTITKANFYRSAFGFDPGSGFAGGGYTGAGGKYEPAGVVHRGEYVVPKHQVNQATGLPKPGFMNAVGGQMPSSRGPSYAGGGFVGGSMMVELSPTDRAIMRQMGMSGEVIVAVDSKEIARANIAGTKKIVAEGGRP